MGGAELLEGADDDRAHLDQVGFRLVALLPVVGVQLGPGPHRVARVGDVVRQRIERRELRALGEEPLRDDARQRPLAVGLGAVVELPTVLLDVLLGRVVRREVYTGLLVGVSLAAVFFPIGLWRWGDASMVTAVALAILAACTTASAVALTLPWLFNRLGLDPAFGSGPLATVIQDLLSVIIYLQIATAMLA